MLGVAGLCAPAYASEEPSIVGTEAIVHPEIWPEIAYPRVLTDESEARVQKILAQMTIEEKVGQILQADLDSVTPEDVQKYHLGSVLNGGNSGPYGNDKAPAKDWLAYADEFYNASINVKKGRPIIPIIWGTDAVHGHSNIIGATLFPHNVGLGAMRDPQLIEKIGRATAIEIRVTGQEWTFAPTVTVPQDYRWGRAYEGYSSDPSLVASYVGSMVRGLQGPPSIKPLLDGPYVLASTKHFLADGGTDGGKDQGDAKISELELRYIHGAPYLPAIENGVATVMSSFSSWQGKKITGHKGLQTDVLKDRMNFEGFIVTDWNAHGQVDGCTNASCPQAVNAGVDMIMAPDSWKSLYHSIIPQVKDGTIPMARLDDAVLRILRVKERLGLFDAGKPSSRPYSGQYEYLGSKEHRDIAREAVRKSMTLLKNTGVLPLKPNGNILVAGDGADDIARQAGGWTISWQGTGLTNDMFPGATSLWGGINQAVGNAGGKAILSPDGSYTDKPDAAIVVFGETPYAEFQGDLASLQLRPELRAPYETMRKLKQQGIPVVAVMITGRPLYVNPVLNLADAFVTAWLPGSEGGGVADMLFSDAEGRVKYDFQGRLPTSWPATAKHGGATLFPFGYGLTLGDGPMKWTNLSEDAAVEDAGTGAGIYFDKGIPAASWSLMVTRANGAESLRVTTVPSSALAGRVKITSTDHIVQEGARKFEITGGVDGAAVELSTQDPIDITRETNGDVLLLTTIRIDKKPTEKLSLSMRCGVNCGDKIPFDILAEQKLGEWNVIGVPLKCFVGSTQGLNKVEAPFILSTYGDVKFSIAKVALGMDADHVVKCK
ncbi:1,4-beta-D-glucan glucohydrolase [Sphingorhabdus lutea]|uniref:1,4-beta-D-glucan glucohydrolase n=2 Tax=Sphingorhabdus lutea TaxID=1913578 RepID=A0A1L3JEC4_9SPHN|nr:1,4-beta-D-glucan glucohydrolase [Sphingorhabdus lutea]